MHRPGMSELVCYPAEDIPTVWGLVSGHVQKALDRGSDYTAQQIYEGLCDRQMVLWTSQKDGYIEAALVTAIYEENGVKSCSLIAAGGENLDSWVDWLGHVEQYAREHGAEELRIYGRYAWLRKLKGFHFVMARKVLCL